MHTDNNLFGVECVIYMSMLAEHAKPEVFERAKAVRNRQKLRAVAGNVDRIVLRAKRGLSRSAALAEMLEMRQLVDEVFGTSAQ